MAKPISISFAPNFEHTDTMLALKLLVGGIHEKKTVEAFASLKKEISKYFENSHVTLFSSGRAGLYKALSGYNFRAGDEVIVQAFTCVAVPSAVMWSGLTPVFVDIDKDTYNIAISDLKEKITKKTRAIIVQHTFGIPANIEKIIALAQKNNIVVIEDLAHGLGSSYKHKKLGLWGDCAVLSFGRDKIISSVFGGAVITKNDQLSRELGKREESLVPVPESFVRQQLFYLIIYAISLPVYSIFLGKLILRSMRLVGLLSKAVYPEEKVGRKPAFIEYTFSRRLAVLALSQFRKLETFSRHRTKIAHMYVSALGLPYAPRPYLRVPYMVTNKDRFLADATRQGIHLGNWYRAPIDPPDSDFVFFNYTQCKIAEEVARKTINLPTHINIRVEDVEKILSFIKDYEPKRRTR